MRTTIQKPLNMKKYQSHKMVTAAPMARGDFYSYTGSDMPIASDEDFFNEPGYLVESLDGGTANHINHGGYIYWSPKKGLDDGYSEILPPFVERVTPDEYKAALVVYEEVFGVITLDSESEQEGRFDLIELAGKLSYASGTFENLCDRGPLYDGDVPSKTERNVLLNYNCCAKVFHKGEDGFNALTCKGGWVLKCIQAMRKN